MMMMMMMTKIPNHVVTVCDSTFISSVWVEGLFFSSNLNNFETEIQKSQICRLKESKILAIIIISFVDPSHQSCHASVWFYFHTTLQVRVWLKFKNLLKLFGQSDYRMQAWLFFLYWGLALFTWAELSVKFTVVAPATLHENCINITAIQEHLSIEYVDLQRIGTCLVLCRYFIVVIFQKFFFQKYYPLK